MSEITVEVCVKQLISVLDEAFNGPAEHFSYFSDRGEAAGLLATLSKVSHEEASRDICGSTIAGQASHLVFAMKATCEFVDGTAYKFDWTKSWEPSQVDAAEWEQLRTQVEIAYNRLRALIEKKAIDSLPGWGASLGAVTHIAYHIGAIRQKLSGIRSSCCSTG